ncbi:MAG: hypothetical protein KUG79_20105 [Pseudomonadales bacterium]|nr:hypothetical protein [Pseudomonadales bacterium]
MKQLIMILTMLVYLTGCGGNEEAPAADITTAADTTAEENAAKTANNPLAKQQQFLQEAKMVQKLFDEDAERKKKALESID